MTVRDPLTELQRLPRDLEVLAFEAGCETTASARSTSSSSRAAGSTSTWGPDATSHRGSRPGPWPRSTLTRRRPCAACEPPSASSRSWRSTTRPTRTRTSMKPSRTRSLIPNSTVTSQWASAMPERLGAPLAVSRTAGADLEPAPGSPAMRRRRRLDDGLLCSDLDQSPPAAR